MSVCAICKANFGEDDSIVNVDDKSIHPNCFNCAKCGLNFITGTDHLFPLLISQDGAKIGQPYPGDGGTFCCGACFHGTCSKCGKPTIGPHLTVEGKVLVDFKLSLTTQRPFTKSVLMCQSALSATKKSMVNTLLWKERATCTKNAILEPINLWWEFVVHDPKGSVEYLNVWEHRPAVPLCDQLLSTTAVIVFFPYQDGDTCFIDDEGCVLHIVKHVNCLVRKVCHKRPPVLTTLDCVDNVLWTQQNVSRLGSTSPDFAIYHRFVFTAPRIEPHLFRTGLPPLNGVMTLMMQ